MANEIFPTNTNTELQAEVFIEEKPEKTWDRIVPIVGGISEGTTSVKAIVANLSGKSKRITNVLGEDTTIVGYTARDVDLPIHTWGHGYTISDEEIRTLSQTNQIDPLRLKIAASREAFEAQMQEIVVNGYDDFKGILNFTMANGAESAASGKWAASGTTAENIANDIITASNGISFRTKGRHRPNRILLPINSFNALVQKRFTDNMAKTAFDSVNETLTKIVGVETNLQWIPVPELDNDVILYPFSDNILRMYNPIYLRYGNPIEKMHGYAVGAEYSASPLEIRNALAFGKITGAA